ncbi:MAG: insulinase family protein [Bacteroidaceae bacterium]|nr:insulinase family protein [Bacteroidaceae bacterium]MBR4040934.1 insulinase family protein [Bacteroidaceae bacterium]
MIHRHTLANGLRIVHHEDTTTQMVAVNLLYNVGARNEDAEHTGYAHLLEHLMFEGSVNIPNYDIHVQLAGGENNAWTNNDLTNYYITIPKSNVETAFWLESDRMLGLALTEQSVKVQKEVVIEEFKQQHLNRPYGDVQHLIRALAYKVHPYRWPTIGITPQHIEQATRDTIMQFYHRYYTPGNAILSVVGNISFDEVVQMAEKWFGSIENKAMPSSTCRYIHTPLMEPEQKRMRRKTVYRHVPSDMLIMAFHMSDRYQQEYHVCDLITDILSAGQSSRLIQRLINTRKLFTSLDAYIQGSLDAGLLYIMGRLSDGVTFEEAEQAVWHELDTLKRVAVPDEELNKVRNRSESERTFNNISYLNRAINLAQLELIGQDPTLEDELTRYCSVTAEDIKHTSRKIFTKKNCSVLYYKKR